MQVIHVPASRRGEWNTFVAAHTSFALLQSWEWGDFKERMGWKAFRIAVEHQRGILAGVQLLIKSLPLGLASMAYVPRGPLGDWLDEAILSRLLCELHQVARRHRAVVLRIEHRQLSFRRTSAKVAPCRSPS